MNKHLLSALAIIELGLASGDVIAQCILQPSCEDLGYKQTADDCANEKVLKCPFDTSKVICAGNENSDNKNYDSGNCLLKGYVATCPQHTVCEKFCTENSQIFYKATSPSTELSPILNCAPGLVYMKGYCSILPKSVSSTAYIYSSPYNVIWGGDVAHTFAQAQARCSAEGGTYTGSYSMIMPIKVSPYAIPYSGLINYVPPEDEVLYRIGPTSCYKINGASVTNVTCDQNTPTLYYCYKGI